MKIMEDWPQSDREEILFQLSCKMKIASDLDYSSKSLIEKYGERAEQLQELIRKFILLPPSVHTSIVDDIRHGALLMQKNKANLKVIYILSIILIGLCMNLDSTASLQSGENKAIYLCIDQGERSYRIPLEDGGIELNAKAGEQELIFATKNSSIIESEILIPVRLIQQETPSKNKNSDFGSLLPTFLGGALTLMGGIITAIWTTRNEARRAKFEWGKLIFERYEKQYRDFIIGLAGTTNPEQIEAYLKRMNESAYIPNHLRTSVEETIDMLENEMNDSERIKIRNELLDKFEMFMQEPWRPGPKQ
jgi:hypothetical protein